MSTKLRQIAEDRLGNGTAPATQDWSAGIQALSLLHDLAISPNTASDALKLLHELQVHQVELDLQHEQAEQDRRQFADDLSNYMALFDLAPFAYFALSSDGLIVAANRLASRWLAGSAGEEGIGANGAGENGTGENGEWAGRRLEDLLAPECRARLRAMLGVLRTHGGRQTCAVQPIAGGSIGHAVATATLSGAQVLMALAPVARDPTTENPGKLALG